MSTTDTVLDYLQRNADIKGRINSIENGHDIARALAIPYGDVDRALWDLRRRSILTFREERRGTAGRELTGFRLQRTITADRLPHAITAPSRSVGPVGPNALDPRNYPSVADGGPVTVTRREKKYEHEDIPQPQRVFEYVKTLPKDAQGWVMIDVAQIAGHLTGLDQSQTGKALSALVAREHAETLKEGSRIIGVRLTRTEYDPYRKPKQVKVNGAMAHARSMINNPDAPTRKVFMHLLKQGQPGQWAQITVPEIAEAIEEPVLVVERSMGRLRQRGKIETRKSPMQVQPGHTNATRRIIAVRLLSDDYDARKNVIKGVTPEPEPAWATQMRERHQRLVEEQEQPSLTVTEYRPPAVDPRVTVTIPPHPLLDEYRVAKQTAHKSRYLQFTPDPLAEEALNLLAALEGQS